MILGQTISYTRQPDRFTAADAAGAIVVHHEFVLAALRTRSVTGIHFFLGGRPGVAEKPDATAQLREIVGPNVEIHAVPLDKLPQLSEVNQYVLPIEIERMPSLALARHTSPRARYPLTGLVHTVSMNNAALFYAALSMVVRPCDCVVATSKAGAQAVTNILDATKEFLARQCGATKMPTLKVELIPFGVDLEHFRACDRRAARLQLGLPTTGTILLYLGRLSERYKADLEPLLVMFQEILRSEPDTVLVLAGCEEQKGYIEQLRKVMAALNVAHQVRVIVDFAADQKVAIYSSADVFISPVDSIQETFGLTLLEAQACELPVVVSDWSGYRDLVIEEQTGYLIPTLFGSQCLSNIGEVASLLHPLAFTYRLSQCTAVDYALMALRLLSLIRNPELRLSMGKRGRQWVSERYSWECVLKAYRDLWTRQWDELLQSDQDPVLLNCRTRAVYGHFASAIVDEYMIAAASGWERDSENDPEAIMRRWKKGQAQRRDDNYVTAGASDGVIRYDA